jgi:hypothetical protein
MQIDWASILTIVGVPTCRAISGWLENAMKDGEISPFEWQQLGSTILRVGFIATATYFGIEGMGFDVTILGAAFSAAVLDIILRAIKNK